MTFFVTICGMRILQRLDGLKNKVRSTHWYASMNADINHCFTLSCVFFCLNCVINLQWAGATWQDSRKSFPVLTVEQRRRRINELFCYTLLYTVQ